MGPETGIGLASCQEIVIKAPFRRDLTESINSLKYFYRSQPSCGQGNIFVPVCHTVHRGMCLPQCMLGYHTPWEQTPPQSRHPPEQIPPGADTPRGADPLGSRHPQSRHCPRSRHPPEQIPPGSRQPPRTDTPHRHPPGADTHPPGSRLRHTVNERPVRILLECILVMNKT